MPDFDEDQFMKAAGKAIARRRQSCNLTQEDLAERLGIGNEAVSRIERGIVMPSVSRLAELADVFQCSLSDLLAHASTRSADQSRYLHGLLSGLATQDRVMIVELVEKLAERLAV